MEHSLRFVDGIAMEDPGGAAPVHPDDLVDMIDSITRKALLEAAAREDNDDA